jgi:PGF-pre-PGF domain-containing protein
VNVSIKNLGPENASNVKVKIFKGNCLSGAYFYLSDCNKYPNPGEEVTFNISAFNYTGCHIVWRVVGGSNETSCTSWINGTVGSWFRNISFETSVYIEPTTTTTLPNITLPTTTTSSTTTTTTTSSTTTTTIPAQQVASESIKISRISPDTPATINIPLIETFKIQRMTIFVNKNVSNVVLNLKEGSKPEGVPPPLKDDEGVVLKYLEISATNISNSDIVNVTMEFQVEKSWVDKNNIDSNTIFLYRYSNNTWNMLQTKKINETMNYYYFNSVSPGFSLFAIAGYKARGLPNWVFYLVVGIIVAAILAFLFWPVKEKKEEVKIDIPYKMEKEKEETKKPWDELKKKWEEIKKKWELKEKKSS